MRNGTSDRPKHSILALLPLAGRRTVQAIVSLHDTVAETQSTFTQPRYVSIGFDEFDIFLLRCFEMVN
jgi:glutaredoxin 2